MNPCAVTSDSDFFAALAHIGKHGIDAVLVDDPHALNGDLQPYETIFSFNPETMCVEIGRKAAPRPMFAWLTLLPAIGRLPVT